MRFSLRFALFATALLAATPALAATIYYFDPVNGLDTYTGTAPEPGANNAGPWKSAQKFKDTAFTGGDFILFKRGTTLNGQLDLRYSGDTVSPYHWITIGAYGEGAYPVINGGTTNMYAMYLYDDRDPLDPHVNNVRFQNIMFTGGTRSSFRALGPSNKLQLQDVFVDAGTSAGTNRIAGFEFDSSDNVTLTRCLAFSSNPSLGSYQYGVKFGTNSSNIRLLDMVVLNSREAGVWVNANVSGYIKIIGGTYNNGHASIGTQTVAGITINGSNNVLIDGVEAGYNDSDSGLAYGIQILGGSQKPIVQNCRLYANKTSGLRLNVHGGNIQHNQFISNGNIANNNTTTSGLQIDHNEINDLQISQNTVYDSHNGIYLNNSDGANLKKDNILLLNNVLYGADNVNLHRALVKDALGGATMANFKSDQNCFYGSFGTGNLVVWNGTGYLNTLAGFGGYKSAATTETLTSQEPGSYWENPSFTDVLTWNFAVQSQHCIGKGY